MAINAADCWGTLCSSGSITLLLFFYWESSLSSPGTQQSLGARVHTYSMVKMSLDPVQVMSGQVSELKVSASSNGESRESWEEKEDFNQDNLGLTTKPKAVSLSSFFQRHCLTSAPPQPIPLLSLCLPCPRAAWNVDTELELRVSVSLSAGVYKCGTFSDIHFRPYRKL